MCGERERTPDTIKKNIHFPEMSLILLSCFLHPAILTSGCKSSSDHHDSQIDSQPESHYESDSADIQQSSDIIPDGPGCPSIDMDGDTIPDSIEGTDDYDGDTIPNEMDEDSDGDTVLDRHEAGDFNCQTPPFDSDGDGKPDYLDEDSDNDTISDREEAGDDNLNSYPVDSDGLGVPDFIDIDSDNDGLSDLQELQLNTDRTSPDTDGDGYSDMEEVASATADPLDPEKQPSENETIVMLYYRGRGEYEIFSATVSYNKNDVFLLIDDTNSNSGTLNQIKLSMEEMLSLIQFNLENVMIGISAYSGWNMDGYTQPLLCFRPFYGFTRLTGDTEKIISSVDQIPTCLEPIEGSSLIEGLDELASEPTPANWAPNSGICDRDDSFGGGCFRNYARRIVMVFHEGDFPSQSPETTAESYTLEEVTQLLIEKGIYVVSFIGQEEREGDGYLKLRQIAEATGALKPPQTALVYPTGGGGDRLISSFEQAVLDIKEKLLCDVTINKEDGQDWPENSDEELDATVFATTTYTRGFVPPEGFSPSEAVGKIADGTFFDTIPGTEVSFKVYFTNYKVKQSQEGRIYALYINIENEKGFVFKKYPVKILVPCLSGDYNEEE